LSVDPDTGHLAEVVPLGRVPPVACAVVAANLQAALGLPTQVIAARAPPPQAHLRARGQYDAALILAALKGDLEPPRLRVGVTALDLCLPILTFVYGEALVGGRVAVVSTARLGARPGAPPGARPGAPPGEPARLYERLAKVALHETAHALGLTHCRTDGCLMVYSVGLEVLDSLQPVFCPACEHRLAVQIYPSR
jgi:archaemetzincin